MTKARLLLFSSLTCPNCPPARKIVEEFASEREDVSIHYYVSGKDGADKVFAQYEVRSVPTILIQGPGYPHNIGLVGVQSKKTLHKYLDMALGFTPVEQKKGFWNTLLNR